jgi:hypothetical protein
VAPDLNGNGIVLNFGSQVTFTNGVCGLALADSGAPNTIAATGPSNVDGRMLKDIGQDLVEWFAWS